MAPLLELAVGRRPYTSETHGALIVRAAGPPLLKAGDTLQISATLPPSAWEAGGGGAAGGGGGALQLLNGHAKAGTTSVIRFSLAALASTVFAELTVTATLPSGQTIVYAKNFQKAPRPANANVTVFTVDHLSKGMLVGSGGETPWLPFLVRAVLLLLLLLPLLLLARTDAQVATPCYSLLYSLLTAAPHRASAGSTPPSRTRSRARAAARSRPPPPRWTRHWSAARNARRSGAGRG